MASSSYYSDTAALGYYVMMIVQDIDSLCGVHALNNLLQQGPLIGSEDMAAIARELDGMQVCVLHPLSVEVARYRLNVIYTYRIILIKLK
jgi:hypothetical protein